MKHKDITRTKAQVIAVSDDAITLSAYEHGIESIHIIKRSYVDYPDPAYGDTVLIVNDSGYIHVIPDMPARYFARIFEHTYIPTYIAIVILAAAVIMNIVKAVG